MEEARELAVVSNRPSTDWSPQHTRLRYEAALSSLLFLLISVFGYSLDLPFLNEARKDIGFTFFRNNSYEITLLGLFITSVIFNLSFHYRSKADFLRLPDIASSIELIREKITVQKSSVTEIQETVSSFKVPDFSSVPEEIINGLVVERIQKVKDALVRDPGKMFQSEWVKANAIHRYLVKQKKSSSNNRELDLMIDNALSNLTALGDEESFNVATSDMIYASLRSYNDILLRAENASIEFIEKANAISNEELRFLKSELQSLEKIVSNADSTLKKFDGALRVDREIFAWRVPAFLSWSMFGVATFFTCIHFFRISV